MELIKRSASALPTRPFWSAQKCVQIFCLFCICHNVVRTPYWLPVQVNYADTHVCNAHTIPIQPRWVWSCHSHWHHTRLGAVVQLVALFVSFNFNVNCCRLPCLHRYNMLAMTKCSNGNVRCHRRSNRIRIVHIPFWVRRELCSMWPR